MLEIEEYLFKERFDTNNVHQVSYLLDACEQMRPAAVEVHHFFFLCSSLEELYASPKN